MLTKDFRDFVALLNAHRVDYLVVGAWAVGVHGHPRYTGDLDVWVQRSAENAARLVAAINEFGFSSFNIAAADFERAERILQLGREPSRIDVMTSITGVEFAGAYRRRCVVDVDGLAVPFIG